MCGQLIRRLLHGDTNSKKNLMQYRVLAANGIVPDGMSTDQQKKMATALASVEKRLKGSAAEIESE